MKTVALLLALLAPAGRSFTIAGEPFAQADIVDARTVPDGSGSAALLLTFTPKGAAHLKALTTSHSGKPMPVLLDGAKIAEPTLSGPIEDGQLQISGTFGSFEAAGVLAKRISGKDPVPEGGE